MRVWWVILAGLITATAIAREKPKSVDVGPFDFQGVVLDTPFPALAKMFKPQQCSEVKRETVCVVDETTVLGGPARVEYRFRSGVEPEAKLYKIEVHLLDGLMTATAVDGLTKRWGNPQSASYTRWVWQRPRYRLDFLNLVGASAIRYVNTDVEDQVSAEKVAEAASGL
jgi:hypothetical protein